MKKPKHAPKEQGKIPSGRPDISTSAYEQQMLEMGCPSCGGSIELYDTNPTCTGGKYRCKNCGRDTSWAVGKRLSLSQVLDELLAKSKHSQTP